MRKLVTIRTVSEIKPIAGADMIELAVVDGWQLVTKKGEFAVGDRGVYFEVDSFLPVRPEFEFLRKNSRKVMRGDEGFRLKTIKLRGEISQGLLLPLAFLSLTGNEQEDDLTELLGVKLYEPDMPAQLAGDAIGLFPSFIPKTDQERVQNLKSTLWGGSSSIATMRYEVSEKMDGSSLTVFNFEDSFGVCSRNLQLKESNSNSYWQVVNRYHLQERLAGHNVAIQGELCGEGIQKNKYKLKGQDLFVFDIYSIDRKRYFCPQERSAFMSCVLPDVKTVPILDRGYMLPEDIQKVLEFAQGKSLVNPKQEREGLVFKEELPLQERVSFKAISNKFLLAEED